ncbi:diguanylate cyclase domain-containing protein [Planococcus citreus]|uniref:diguanylate cyclase domain-containing protein n=1 Tax=Planococcus citreus TaxID=1373 RepID=UPI000EAFE620|nr:diguanylate cyclase [Planococcus citreus]
MGSKPERLALERVLLEGIEEMIFIVRVEPDAWVYEFINEAVKTNTQLDGSVLGKSFREVHEPEIARQLKHFYEKALAEGASIFYEDSYYAPNGELRYSKSRLTPMFDKTGRCSHIVSVVNDVTEEKLAKHAREEALNRLEESNAKYRSLFESNGDAVFTLTLGGQINGGNRMARALVQRPISELAGRDFCGLVEQSERVRSKEIFEEAAAGLYKDHRLSLQSKDGNAIGCLVKFIPISVQGRVTGYYMMAKNMTELDRLVSKYLESEKNFRVIAENVYDVVVLMNRQKEYLYVSPSSQEIFGIASEEAVKQKPFFNVHPDDLALVDQQFQEAVQQAGPYSLQLRFDHPGRGWIWGEMNGTPVYDEEGAFSHMVMIVRDISVQKKYEAQLEYYAFHDSLTGLPNRRYFQEYSRNKLRNQEQTDGKIALAVLDLDDFKRINDDYGHDFGDMVLTEFAVRLAKLEKAGYVAARMGGDEFVVILEGVTTNSEALAAAEKIRAELTGDWTIQGNLVPVNFSLGTAIALSAEESISSILRRADKAMYQAKGNETDTIKILQP